MKNIFKGIFDRLKEPSTHATFTAVLAGVGVTADSTAISATCYILAGIAGLLGVFLKEGK